MPNQRPPLHQTLPTGVRPMVRPYNSSLKPPHDSRSSSSSSQVGAGHIPMSVSESSPSHAVPPLRPVDNPEEVAIQYPLEGGVYAPLLDPSRYTVRTVTAPLPASRGRTTARRRSMAMDPKAPRLVVDGVEDLRNGTTGILSRHLNNLQEAPRPQYLANEPSENERQDFFNGDPNDLYRPAPVPPPTVDDRVTPQTLHVLLRKGRTAVAKVLPPSSGMTSRYYSFVPNKTKSNNSINNNANNKLMATVPAALLPSATATDKTPAETPRQKLRARGQQPSQFVKATHTKFAAKDKKLSKKDNAAAEAGASAENNNNNIDPEGFDLNGMFSNFPTPRERDELQPLKIAVEHLEPPHITMADAARYYTGEDSFETTDKCPTRGGGGRGGSSHGAAAASRSAATTEQMSPRSSAKSRGGKTDEVAEMIKEDPTMGVLDKLVDDHDEAEHLPSAQPSMEFAFTAAARGDDTALVSQLVRFYGKSMATHREEQRERMLRAPTDQRLAKLRGGEGGSSVATATQSASSRPTTSLNKAEVPFSLLEATLAVSREYEKLHKSFLGSDTAPVTDTFLLSRNRQAVCNRLTGVESSLIPEQYWVSVHHRGAKAEQRERSFLASTAASAEMKSNSALNATGGSNSFAAGASFLTDLGQVDKATAASSISRASRCPNPGRNASEPSDTLVLFPASRPVGRAQVYLLAEALDHMLSIDPDWLPTLADPSVAYRILADGEEETVARGKEAANPLLDMELRKNSDEAYEAYTNASQEVISVVNTGLVELVRQVSSQCVERGALLDALRQTLVDIAESHAKVLQRTKRRAHAEAYERLQLRAKMDEMQAELDDARSHINDRKDEITRLLKEREVLAEKAGLLDSLMARIEAKKQRFEIHTGEEHAEMLKELEHDMAISASEALDTVFEERIRIARKGDDSDEDTKQVPSTDAPSAEEARKRASEQKGAMNMLYDQSRYLLKALTDATDAMNAASAPIYDKVVLSSVSPQGNVAASKWASYARAIGVFEREKNHRQRVFKVFCDWCNRYQKKRGVAFDMDAVLDADGLPKTGAFLVQSGSDDGYETMSNEDLMEASAATCMSLPSEMQTRSRRMVEGARAEGGEEEEKVEMKGYNQGLKSIQYVTSKDLMDMGAMDCSPAEVNVLFERDFDFKGFLHTPWDPAKDGPEWSLSLADVAEMLCDVRSTLKEMTVRMRAIATSSIVQKGVEPPMQPPARPEDRCNLCGRRDVVNEERRRRQELLQQIANDVQERVDELTERYQRAEAEREDARGDCRRLEMERDAAITREKDTSARLDAIVRDGLSSGQAMRLGRIPSASSVSPKGIIRDGTEKKKRGSKRAVVTDPKDVNVLRIESPTSATSPSLASALTPSMTSQVTMSPASSPSVSPISTSPGTSPTTALPPGSPTVPMVTVLPLTDGEDKSSNKSINFTPPPDPNEVTRTYEPGALSESAMSSEIPTAKRGNSAQRGARPSPRKRERSLATSQSSSSSNNSQGSGGK